MSVSSPAHPASQTAAHSPTLLMNTVRGITGPLSTLTIGAAADVLAPALAGFREVVSGAVDFSAASADATCIIDGILSAQPDESRLLAFLDQVNASAMSLAEDAALLESCIGNVTVALNASEAVADLLSGNLSTLSVLVTTLNATLDALVPPLINFAGNVSLLTDPSSGLPAAYGASGMGGGLGTLRRDLCFHWMGSQGLRGTLARFFLAKKLLWQLQ